MKVPTEPQSSDTSERLYLSCKRLFAEKGFAGAKTREIAKLAGSSESQLLKHIGNKEEILLTLFRRGWQQIRERAAKAIEGETDPFACLLKLMRAAVEVLEQDRELATIFLLEGRRIGKGGQALLISNEFYEFLELIDNLIQQAQRRGLFRGFNPQALRSALFGAAEGMLRDRLLAQRAGFPANYSLEDIQQTFSILFSALARLRLKKQKRSRAKAAR